MTDRSKFELMLDALINEQQDKAKEIFHDIVVEKSREIYENLLADDMEDDEDMEENLYVEPTDPQEESSEDDSDSDIGGDASDDFMSDVGDDEEGSEDDMGDEGDIEDRVMDLEDALDELKSEFEQLMAGEEGEGHEMGGMDDDMMGGDDMGDMGMDEPEEESYSFEAHKNDDEDEDDLEESLMREYVEKVSAPKHGDNGVNTRSVVAKPNRMGGTSANIAKSFSTEKGGTQGGLLNPSTKEENFGNMNVPGAKAGKTAFKKHEPGHGAEKKGKPEQADNKKSIVGSR
jgi:hypothetical protein